MSKNLDGSTFSSDGKTLWRNVVPSRTDRGQQPYVHSCTRETFENVCHDIDELDGERFSIDQLVTKGDYPISQVATALAFLDERGIIDQSGRFRIALSDSVHLDGMTEFHALHEEPETH